MNILCFVFQLNLFAYSSFVQFQNISTIHTTETKLCKQVCKSMGFLFAVSAPCPGVFAPVFVKLIFPASDHVVPGLTEILTRPLSCSDNQDADKMGIASHHYYMYGNVFVESPTSAFQIKQQLVEHFIKTIVFNVFLTLGLSCVG